MMNGQVGDLLQAVGITFIHTLWIGGLWGLLGFVVLLALRRAAPQTRYLSALFFLTILALVPVVLFPLSLRDVTPSPEKTYLLLPSETAKKELWHMGPDGRLGSIPDQIAVTLPEARPIHRMDARSSERLLPAPGAAFLPQWATWLRLRATTLEKIAAPVSPWLALFWMGGVALLTIRFAVAARYIRRLRVRDTAPLPASLQAVVQELCETAGIRRTITALASIRARVPMVVGWFSPLVLVPAELLTGLPPDQLRLVLAHELAHIKRLDPLVNLLQLVVETLLFYHPAVWCLSREVRRTRELCCDDLALSWCGQPLEYAHALVHVAEQAAPTPTMALASSGKPLQGRIERILAGPVPRTTTAPGVALIAALVAPCVVVSGIVWAELGLRDSTYSGDPIPQALAVDETGQEPDVDGTAPAEPTLETVASDRTAHRGDAPGKAPDPQPERHDGDGVEQVAETSAAASPNPAPEGTALAEGRDPSETLPEEPGTSNPDVDRAQPRTDHDVKPTLPAPATPPDEVEAESTPESIEAIHRVLATRVSYAMAYTLSLRDLLDYIETEHGLEIRVGPGVDHEAITRIGKSRGKARGVSDNDSGTLAEILTASTELLGLTWTEHADHLQISGPEAQDPLPPDVEMDSQSTPDGIASIPVTDGNIPTYPDKTRHRVAVEASALSPHMAQVLGTPVSLEFEDVELREVFDFMARAYDLQVFYLPAPDGETPLNTRVVPYTRLRNQPLGEALSAILQPLGLQYRVQNNALMVGEPQRLDALLELGGKPWPALPTLQVSDTIAQEHLHTILDRWGKSLGLYFHVDPYLVAGPETASGASHHTDGMVHALQLDGVPLPIALERLLAPLGLNYWYGQPGPDTGATPIHPSIWISTPSVLEAIAAGRVTQFQVELALCRLDPVAYTAGYLALRDSGYRNRPNSGDATLARILPDTGAAEHPAAKLDQALRAQGISTKEVELLSAPRISTRAGNDWWPHAASAVSTLALVDHTATPPSQTLKIRTLRTGGCAVTPAPSLPSDWNPFQHDGVSCSPGATVEIPPGVTLIEEDTLLPGTTALLGRYGSPAFIADYRKVFDPPPLRPERASPVRAGRRNGTIAGRQAPAFPPETREVRHYHEGLVVGVQVLTREAGKAAIRLASQYRPMGAGAIPWTGIQTQFELLEGDAFVLDYPGVDASDHLILLVQVRSTTTQRPVALTGEQTSYKVVARQRNTGDHVANTGNFGKGGSAG